jgi:hypothetical protein
LLLAPKLRPDKAPSTNYVVPLRKSASNNLRKWFLSPTGRLNFGFITEGKLTILLITPYSLGSQLVYAPVACMSAAMSSLHHRASEVRCGLTSLCRRGAESLPVGVLSLSGWIKEDRPEGSAQHRTPTQHHPHCVPSLDASKKWRGPALVVASRRRKPPHQSMWSLHWW